MKKTLLLTLLALPLVISGCDSSHSWKKVSKEDSIIVYTGNGQHSYNGAEYQKLEYWAHVDVNAPFEISVKYTLTYDTKSHIDIYTGNNISIYYKDN